MVFEDVHKAFLALGQKRGRPLIFCSDFLRQYEGRCLAFALEVGVLLLGKVVVAGGRVLVPIKRNQIGQSVRPAIALVFIREPLNPVRIFWRCLRQDMLQRHGILKLNSGGANQGFKAQDQRHPCLG